MAETVDTMRYCNVYSIKGYIATIKNDVQNIINIYFLIDFSAMIAIQMTKRLYHKDPKMSIINNFIFLSISSFYHLLFHKNIGIILSIG